MKLPSTTRRSEIAILAVLGACVVGSVGEDLVSLRGRMAVRSAESRLLALHGDWRRLATERGVPMRFVADPSTQTVTIVEGCTGEGRVLESRDFSLSYRVDIRTAGGPIDLCMTPRGEVRAAESDYEGTVTLRRGSFASSVTLSRVVGAHPR